MAPRPVLEKLNLGKQGADLCSSPVTQLFVAAYFAERDWRVYLEQLKALYRTRRDAMLQALGEHFGEQAHWTTPQGGLFIWATLRGDVDTKDLLAHAEGVAFVPGSAAYMDGRRGASSMRLNFAGVPEEDIREGIRRIGEAVGDQLTLYGTLTGTSPAKRPAKKTAKSGGAGKIEAQSEAPPAPPAETSPGAGEGDLADVVELPRRRAKGR